MTGLIWLIQIVHYQLFNKVGFSNFVEYHSAHTLLITYIVMPIMLLELFTYLNLAYYNFFTHKDNLILGLALLGIWSTTIFLSVPTHQNLSNGFNVEQYEFLLNTNWIRTILWTLKSICLILILNNKIIHE